MKSGKDPLISYRTRLEDLDVKVIIPYVIDATTHVVSSKRNTAKGLQALINAKYIVAETYIDALIYATTPDNLDELESLSPLEDDFDAHWPNALDHLPAKSKEPSERPVAEFVPKPLRNNVFEGYTFVFCDQIQFDSLQAPITNGGGKALHFIPLPGKTTTEDIVRYVKGIAGEKGLGEFEDGSEGKGVVVVRFRGKKEFAEWAANLDTQIALALGQRLIEQSEFMDAILMIDASILRRPLLPEDDDCESSLDTVLLIMNQCELMMHLADESFRPAATAGATDQAAAPVQDVVETVQSGDPESTQPAPRRARARGAVIKRFKGYDSDDDDDIKPVATQTGSLQSQMRKIPTGGRSQSHSVSILSADRSMIVTMSEW